MESKALSTTTFRSRLLDSKPKLVNGFPFLIYQAPGTVILGIVPEQEACIHTFPITRLMLS